MQDTRIAIRAKELGISTVPAVVIDGKLAECCKNRGVDGSKPMLPTLDSGIRRKACSMKSSAPPG